MYILEHHKIWFRRVVECETISEHSIRIKFIDRFFQKIITLSKCVVAPKTCQAIVPLKTSQNLLCLSDLEPSKSHVNFSLRKVKYSLT